MSEAPGPALGPETTLESGSEPAGDARREQLAAALDALEPSDGVELENPPEAPQEAATTAPEAAPETPETPQTPQPWDNAPTSWKKEHHELYAKADPALRQYITQREDEMRRGIEQVIPKAKFADEITQAIQPFQQNLQASGLPPAQAIQTLMQADNILRNAPPEQKIAYAKNLLAQYGVEMGGEQWNAIPAPDPRLHSFQSELQSVKNTVQSFVQEREQGQQAQLASEIEAFAQQKPHFEAVRPAMSQLLLSGQAASLDEAYEKAIEPWKATLEAAERGRQAAEAEEKRKAADAAAKAARAAAVQVRSSTPGRAPQPKAHDRLGLLREQFDALDSRV